MCSYQLSADIICSEKRALFRARNSMKTVRFEEQIWYTVQRQISEEGLYCKPKYRAILFKIFYSIIPFYLILVISVIGITVYILYSKISTDPGLLKIRHSHQFVAVVIQILIPDFRAYFRAKLIEEIVIIFLQLFLATREVLNINRMLPSIYYQKHIT